MKDPKSISTELSIGLPCIPQKIQKVAAPHGAPTAGAKGRPSHEQTLRWKVFSHSSVLETLPSFARISKDCKGFCSISLVLRSYYICWFCNDLVSRDLGFLHPKSVSWRLQSSFHHWKPQDLPTCISPLILLRHGHCHSKAGDVAYCKSSRHK